MENKTETETMADRIRHVAEMVELRAEKIKKAEDLKSEASELWIKILKAAAEIPAGIYLVDKRMFRVDTSGFLSELDFMSLD